jgi:four helix bundle protein
MEIKAFEDLEVFQRAYKLSLEIHRVSLTMPQIEQYALADQLRRASKSICVNVAEGFAKQSYSAAEFKRFIQMSIGSADEMRVWIRYGYDLGYIDQAMWQRWRDEYQEIAKMLQGVYRSWK